MTLNPLNRVRFIMSSTDEDRPWPRRGWWNAWLDWKSSINSWSISSLFQVYFLISGVQKLMISVFFLLTISGHASPSGNGETLCRLCTEERSPRESSGSRMYLFSHDWNGRYSCSGLRAVCHSGICFRLSAGPVLNHPTCIPDHSFASQGTIASYHQYIIGLYCLRRFYYNAILNLYIKKNQKASLHL